MVTLLGTLKHLIQGPRMVVQLVLLVVRSVRSPKSHPDLLVTQHHHHPLFQITPVLNDNIELSLSEPSGDDLGTTLARLWHTLAYFGILWHTLAYSGIL